MDEIRRVAVEVWMDILLLQEPYSFKGNIPCFGVKSKVTVGQGLPMAAVVILSEEFDCVVIGGASNSEEGILGLVKEVNTDHRLILCVL